MWALLDPQVFLLQERCCLLYLDLAHPMSTSSVNAAELMPNMLRMCCADVWYYVWHMDSMIFAALLQKSIYKLYQLMHAAGLLTCYRTHKPACLLRWGLCGDFKFCDETSLFKKPAAYCICAYFSSVNAAELMPPMCTCASLPQMCGSTCGTWSYVTSAALQLQSTCILCQTTHAASFGNITGSLSLHVCYTLGSMWVLQDLCGIVCFPKNAAAHRFWHILNLLSRCQCCRGHVIHVPHVLPLPQMCGSVCAT